jgi:hypothetical protein
MINQYRLHELFQTGRVHELWKANGPCTVEEKISRTKWTLSQMWYKLARIIN